MFARLALVSVTLIASAARGDGLVVVGGSPRAIARAGAGTVGDDGGGALLVNPASLARRSGERVQLGAAIVDDSVTFEGASAGSTHAHDQAGSSLAPLAAVEGSLGDWVLGAGVMTEAVTSRGLRNPADLPADQLGAAFPYRYTGISGTIRRDTVVIGAARRLGESVAIGASVGASRVHIDEVRRIWAGFGARDTLMDPQRDLQLAMSAEDGFAPRATLGVMVAPEGLPLELGASLAWEATAHATGSLSTVGSMTTASVTSPTASIALPEPWTARIGARYVGERLVAELDADLYLFGSSAAESDWAIRGVRVVDSSSAGVDLTKVPSRVSEKTRGALRAAVDVELINGFLWAIAGYSFQTIGTTTARLSPTFADLGGSTLGLGLEVNAGSFSLTFGWSRTWAIDRLQDHAVWNLDNPFGKGDAPVTPGNYDSTADQVGILVDIELDPL